MPELKHIVEAALLAAAEPLSVERIENLFEEHEQPTRDDIREALKTFGESLDDRGVELIEVASGFRLQVKQDLAPWISRLWEQRPTRYSRALLETLALIAYRQPITRGEIEDIRGVAVSTHITRTLLDREWIKVLGHREVPGRPALFGTTKAFLDYFNLKNLGELQPLSELRDLDAIGAELDIGAVVAASDSLDGEDVEPGTMRDMLEGLNSERESVQFQDREESPDLQSDQSETITDATDGADSDSPIEMNESSDPVEAENQVIEGEETQLGETPEFDAEKASEIESDLPDQDAEENQAVLSESAEVKDLDISEDQIDTESKEAGDNDRTTT